MMLLYNFAVSLYHGLISMAATWNRKASQFTTGRKESRVDLKRYASLQHERTYWFHCASLREFEQAGPLIEYLKKSDPGITIALSFFSPSGYLVRKNYAYAEIVFYLPRDSQKNAGEVLKLLSPQKIFFIKYEFWLNYIDAISKAGIPLYLISALFRKDQVFFKWYGPAFRTALSKFTKIFCQDEASQLLLSGLGIKGFVTGDTRFDRVLENRAHPLEEPLIKVFKQNKNLVIIGSSWEEEERIAFEAFDPGLNFKILLAPHDPTRNIIIPERFKAVRFSIADEESAKRSDVLILDSVGRLSSIFGYADLAIIGGGFRGALHNILEPAAFSVPVLFGPDTAKQPEALALCTGGGGIIINNAADLKKFIHDLEADPERLQRMGELAYEYVKAHAGATLKIVKEIQN
jgi:3-deoxy-D-manno-octulosonic-acid transferase